jgi:hypothetical protein
VAHAPIVAMSTISGPVRFVQRRTSNRSATIRPGCCMQMCGTHLSGPLTSESGMIFKGLPQSDLKYTGIFIGRPGGIVVASGGTRGFAPMISGTVVLNRAASAGSVSPDCAT